MKETELFCLYTLYQIIKANEDCHGKAGKVEFDINDEIYKPIREWYEENKTIYDVIEIIRKKDVDMDLLIASSDVDYYNDSETEDDHCCLTTEEFDLLKRFFINDNKM